MARSSGRHSLYMPQIAGWWTDLGNYQQFTHEVFQTKLSNFKSYHSDYIELKNNIRFNRREQKLCIYKDNHLQSEYDWQDIHVVITYRNAPKDEMKIVGNQAVYISTSVLVYDLAFFILYPNTNQIKYTYVYHAAFEDYKTLYLFWSSICAYMRHDHRIILGKK